MLKEGLESFRTASSAASQMGGVKMSLKEKTAADRHRELMGDPNFKKRLSANKETRAQIFEKAAEKRYKNIVKKYDKDFHKGFIDKFGKPLGPEDIHLINIINQQLTDRSKVTKDNIDYIKSYRAKSKENRGKSQYIYTKLKKMKEASHRLNLEARRTRDALRKWDNQESSASTDGEVKFLENHANVNSRLMRLPGDAENPYGHFTKLSPNEGNQTNTPPIVEIDTAEKDVEMSDEIFDNQMFNRRGGRTRRKRTKSKKRKTKSKKKRKTKSKKKRKTKSKKKRKKRFL